MGMAMIPGGGKRKGNSFERSVCKDLSLWISGGGRVDVFWRSSASGGRATTLKNRHGVSISSVGDICAVSPEGHKLTDRFYIECKAYNDLNILGLLTGKGKLVDFWHETMQLATMHKKLPMLIAKQNRVLPLVCLCHTGARDLEIENRALLIAPMQNMRIVPFHELLKASVRFL